jgi:hypothetical protein
MQILQQKLVFFIANKANFRLLLILRNILKTLLVFVIMSFSFYQIGTHGYIPEPVNNLSKKQRVTSIQDQMKIANKAISLVGNCLNRLPENMVISLGKREENLRNLGEVRAFVNDWARQVFLARLVTWKIIKTIDEFPPIVDDEELMAWTTVRGNVQDVYKYFLQLEKNLESFNEKAAIAEEKWKSVVYAGKFGTSTHVESYVEISFYPGKQIEQPILQEGHTEKEVEAFEATCTAALAAIHTLPIWPLFNGLT